MGHTSLEDPRVALVRLSERHAASVRATTQPHRLRHTIDSFHELVMCAIGEQGLAPAGPLFARFHQMGSAIAVEAGVPLAQPIVATGVVLPSSLPGGPMLRCRYYGALEELAAVRDTMARLRKIHGLSAVGAPWESYLIDRRDVFDEEDRITEVVQPVRSTLARQCEAAKGPRRPGQADLLVRRAIR